MNDRLETWREWPGETLGDKHAQQVLAVSGPVSEQIACHASAQRRVCPLLPDVMLSAAKHLGAPRARCFAALSMTTVKAARRDTPAWGTFASSGTSSLLEASGAGKAY